MKKDSSRKKKSATKDPAGKPAAGKKAGGTTARGKKAAAAGAGRGDAPKARKVRFEVLAGEAVHVAVAGTFNGWDPGALALERSRDGRWSAEVRLPPGWYQYRFVVDGVWSDHAGAGGKHVAERDPVANDFGGLNRLIEVD